MTEPPMPMPKPLPTVTVTVTEPAPITTVTGTVNVVQEPEHTPLADHLQGWGTVAAVMVALVLAIVETVRRKNDQTGSKELRNEDREDADRRLQEEREAGDRRLQRQIDEQRELDRRRFIAEQLQKAANLWSQGEVAQLPGVLVAIPDQYATILRYLARGEDYNQSVGFQPLSDTTLAALEDQLVPRGLVNHGAEQYLITRIREMEKHYEAQGKSKGWGRLHPRAVELYRVGYDYKEVKLEWLYEEIGANIADVLGARAAAQEGMTTGASESA